MLNFIQHITYVYKPIHLVLFLWCIAIAGLVIYRVIARHRVASYLAELFKRRMLLNYSFPKSIAKVVIYIVGCLFLVLAGMRFRGKEEKQTEAKKATRDVLIALDISRSMLAQDVLPSRITHAKNKIKQLAQELDAERVGLMLFSGSAFIHCPLTEDKSAFLQALDLVEMDTIVGGTTALDQVLKRTVDMFERLPQKKNKLLVIFTDGEDFSEQLAQCKKVAEYANLYVVTVGVGTPEGAPIPVLNKDGEKTGHLKDAQGAVVISRLNDDLLRSLSREIGGKYIPSTSHMTDVHDIVSFVRKFDREVVDGEAIHHQQELYHYFLMVSFLCFGIEWIW